MVGSRTIKTLSALLAAMTVGAIILLILEPPPIKPGAPSLIAQGPTQERNAPVVTDTSVPLQPIWRNIIIHTSAERGVAERCHFIVGANADSIRGTDCWKRQVEGTHTFVPGWDYNADGIGICVEGDFSRQPPTRAQFEALMWLVRSLQRKFGIMPQSVYLYSQLDFQAHSPGDAFPTNAFTESLIRPAK
jgi:hypothetical protein